MTYVHGVLGCCTSPHLFQFGFAYVLAVYSSIFVCLGMLRWRFRLLYLTTLVAKWSSPYPYHADYSSLAFRVWPHRCAADWHHDCWIPHCPAVATHVKVHCGEFPLAVVGSLCASGPFGLQAYNTLPGALLRFMLIVMCAFCQQLVACCCCHGDTAVFSYQTLIGNAQYCLS